MISYSMLTDRESDTEHRWPERIGAKWKRAAH